MTELRQRPAQVDRASFRDLGPMVDQILDLAEKQAGAITEAAAKRAAELHEAEKALAAAREQAAREVRSWTRSWPPGAPSRSRRTRSGGPPPRPN